MEVMERTKDKVKKKKHKEHKQKKDVEKHTDKEIADCSTSENILESLFGTSTGVNSLAENVNQEQTDVKQSAESAIIEQGELIPDKVTTTTECTEKLESIGQLMPTTSETISYPSLAKEQASEAILQLPEMQSDKVMIKPDESAEQSVVHPFTEQELASLYANGELNLLENFVTDFVDAELNGGAHKQIPLYELLVSYLQYRSKLKRTETEIEHLVNDCDKLDAKLWILNQKIKHQTSLCADRVSVQASYSYMEATFDHSNFKSVLRMKTKVEKIVNDAHLVFSFMSHVLKLQIDYYLQHVINGVIGMSHLKPDSPVLLQIKEPAKNLQPFLNDLRLCISILFQFQRKVIRDKDFVEETRRWLDQLIALLLRSATWQDHLFILNHVLRCPPGIHSWAVKYIQAPLDTNVRNPFASYEVNHAITLLTVILLPIDKRETFLRELSCQPDVVEALWVVVDSDGEEDDDVSGTPLRENDIVALINQLPLNKLFKAVLLYDNRALQGIPTANHTLRLLSFLSTVLQILQKGLQTYNHIRYMQLCKRLCRLIRHIVQYATDQFKLYNNSFNDDQIFLTRRLQVEYDAFFSRAFYYLYIFEKLGSWQFLAVLPFGTITQETLWKLFYFLHDFDSNTNNLLDTTVDTNEYMKKLWTSTIRISFEEHLSNLPEDECYYFLSTLTNMALDRKEMDMEFINAVTMDLLHIGFISETTSDKCSKNIRILLSSIALKFSNLLSTIFKTVFENMDSIKDLSLYLYDELPISAWKVTESDMNRIESLLIMDYASIESKLARVIISRLNWDFDRYGEVFLSYAVHCKTATLIAKCAENDSNYTNWAWQTALRLKLHITDKGIKSFAEVKDIEFYDVIYKGVRDKQPLCAFLSVLMSSWGHLLPQVSSHGLDQLLFLQMHYKHEATLFALNLIIPLFLTCQESLINLEKYQLVLLGLINADRTYVNMAKSLVVKQNMILEQFGFMIETQIAHFRDFNLDSPRYIVRLWMHSFVSITNWNRDDAVLYLLNVTIKSSLFHPECLEVVEEVLREMLQNSTPIEPGNPLGSLLKWASPMGSSQTNMLVNLSLASYSYLAAILINLEFEERESSTGLWNEVLLQLHLQSGKPNIDSAIKKAANKLKVPSFSSASLCIYRWAQQALDTPIDHPILVLFWQKFFTLYLHQVSIKQQTVSVGAKFFEGIVNNNFLKKLKKKIQESVDFYKLKTTDPEFEELSASRQNYYQAAYRIFNCFSLWLEEPRLHNPDLYLPGIPPQYEPQLLNSIFQGKQSFWMEYVDYETIEEEKAKNISTWATLNFRAKKKVNTQLKQSASFDDNADPWVCIEHRLNSYDSPLEPTPLKLVMVVIPQIDVDDNRSLWNFIIKHIQHFISSSELHQKNIREHDNFISNYKQLIVKQYSTVRSIVRQTCPCTGPKEAVLCSGPKVIKIEVMEAKLNDNVTSALNSLKDDYSSFIKTRLEYVPKQLIESSVLLQHIISLLETKKLMDQKIAPLGAKLFYHLFSFVNEDLNNFAPARTIISQCMERLGQSFIHAKEYETPKLLKYIFENPNNSALLVPHFSPVHSGTASFLLTYESINSGLNSSPDLLYSLLSKFDINKWLTTNSPKLSQRSQLITSIMKALLEIGPNPDVAQLAVDEIYRKHLMSVFKYQFPEHYGEILMLVLKASTGESTDSININVWLDIFNYLAHPITVAPGPQLRDQLRSYAHNQKLLNYQELMDTTKLLANHFTNERLQFGLYGLYPKSRNYVEVISSFFGMIGHAFIVSALQIHQGILGDKLCEIIWPYLRDMFSPWVIPYSKNSLKNNVATWIQQLTDDRNILLPWNQSDTPYAQKMMNMFFECVLFIIQTLPASNNILNYFWQWYISNFAHSAVKGHIISVIQQSFNSLPWYNFSPTVPDLEMMFGVSEMHLPECHKFLGRVFLDIKWKDWLSALSQQANIQIRKRVYYCLISLIVKICNEPKVPQQLLVKAEELLIQAEKFEWNLVEPQAVAQATGWYTLSVDSSVVLKTDSRNLDLQLIKFLRGVCCYTNQYSGADKDILEKRHIFVKTYTKLVTLYVQKHKPALASKEKILSTVVLNELVHLESVVVSHEEMNNNLGEILSLLDIIGSEFQSAIIAWVASKQRKKLVTRSILETLGNFLNNISVLSTLYEVSIASYFDNDVLDEEIGWNEVSNYLRTNPTNQAELVKVILADGKILTLYAMLLKKINSCPDIKILLNTCLSWLSNLKITSENEAKIPLLWFAFIDMSSKLALTDESTASEYFFKFAQYLNNTSENTESDKWGGWLGAIGIGKANRDGLKFVARALAGYIMSQLPETKGGPKKLRREANAPCAVGQTGGNAVVSKILLKLDFGQSQGIIKKRAEEALVQIQDPQNSIHNTDKFLENLLLQFYNNAFLKVT